MAIELPLDLRFRLIHEPLRSGEHSWLALGEQVVASTLAQRLHYSDSGCLLVTGFRGVGKTTAVREALRLLAIASGEQVVALELSLARPMSREQLLFEMVRRLYEQLDDQGVLNRLTPTIQDMVGLAYARTSLSMAKTSSELDERQRQFGIGGNTTFGGSVGTVAVPGPRLSLNRKRSQGLSTELRFLAYSAADAEHDLHRILDCLQRLDAERRGILHLIASKLGIGAPTRPMRVKVVMVLDEIDKLTESDGGLASFETLIGSLKNLLSSSGLHFIVVGGVDLHDAWVRDTAGPNSLYRSIFSWHAYTPCVWGQAPEMLTRVCGDRLPHDSLDVNVLAQYLEFTARGILRTLLFEVNSLAVWTDDSPRLVVSAPEFDRVSLMACLQEWLNEFFTDVGDRNLLSSPVDDDRIRLVSYYAIDWVLRSGGTRFTASQLAARDPPIVIDPILRPSSQLIERLLEHLATRGFLASYDPNSASVTHAGPRGPQVSQAADKIYWLSPAAQHDLREIAMSGGRGRAQVHDTVAPDLVALLGGARGEIPEDLLELLTSRFELGVLLGMGGMASVWSAKAIDGAELAIKIFTLDLGEYLEGTEPEKLCEIKHPNIVRTHSVLRSTTATALVMEFIDGRSLHSVETPMLPSTVVFVFDRLLGALDYLHSRGWTRLDIKPANILLRSDDDPVIVDLGIAIQRKVPVALKEAPFVGTLAYSAPEVFEGTVDIRSDLYSLCLTMAEVAGASHRRSVGGKFDFRPSFEEISASAEFRGVLERGLELDSAKRYQTPADMRSALHETPEWTLRRDAS